MHVLRFVSVQRLAASALCNLSANHDENKKLSRAAGLMDALITMLKTTTDDAVQVPFSLPSYHFCNIAFYL